MERLLVGDTSFWVQGNAPLYSVYFTFCISITTMYSLEGFVFFLDSSNSFSSFCLSFYDSCLDHHLLIIVYYMLVFSSILSPVCYFIKLWIMILGWQWLTVIANQFLYVWRTYIYALINCSSSRIYLCFVYYSLEYMRHMPFILYFKGFGTWGIYFLKYSIVSRYFMFLNCTFYSLFI